MEKERKKPPMAMQKTPVSTSSVLSFGSFILRSEQKRRV
jgi:hypothetical protein